MTDSTERSNCWSITINNPTDDDLKPMFPNNKWIMNGQMEQGTEGTVHYQGMLTTPQVRFSQVKKCLPRAHIEIAKNKSALQKYVSKDETRLAIVETISNNIPTLFDYQHAIANKWNDNEFNKYIKRYDKLPLGEVALMYVDDLVSQDITNGTNGIEYIAINPMWRSAWKKFWKSMIERERKLKPTVEYNDGIPGEENHEEGISSQTQGEHEEEFQT